MDQLRAMRVFARVVDEGGFARAAKALDIAPAVATRLVAELEEHLGARLLHRTTRRLALTETGDAYLERTRAILRDIDDAEALAQAATAEPRGLLRVQVPPAFAVHQLTQHLPRLRARYPRVSIELSVTQQLETTFDEHHDVTLLVLREPPTTGQFMVRPLARSEMILCATPEFLDRHGRPTHPQQLAELDYLLPLPASERRELTFTRFAAPQERVTVEFHRTPPLAATHADTLYAAALAGLGITGLPSFVVGDALLEQALERVLPQWSLRSMHIVAALPTRQHLPARIRVFLDYLVEVFGGDARRDPWLAAAGCETCP